MNKRIMLIVIFTVVVLLTLPVILSGMMTIEFFGKALGSADGWLSYWGGYLGAMLGLAAIAVTTQLQISAQQKMHKEQLEEQEKSLIEMHESQMEIQKYSIDQSAKANDKKERDLIYTKLLMDKNEELIEILIELNRLNTERFILLNEYVHYQSILTSFEREESSRFENNLMAGSKESVEQNEEKVKLKRNRLIAKIEEIKRIETEVRIKMRGISAIIKSKSMHFNELADRIDRYRSKVSLVSDEFYQHIENEDIEMEEFSVKVEERADELHRMTNEILNICQGNLLDIIHTLIEGEHS